MSMKCEYEGDQFPTIPTHTVRQEVGNHYEGAELQCWDVVDMLGLSWLSGNVLKYLVRHRKKNGKDDLLKALDYLCKEISTCYDVYEGEIHEIVRRHRWKK